MSIADFLGRYIREEISLAAPILAWAVNRSYRDRPQLNQSIRHSFTYLIDQPLVDSEGKFVAKKQTVQVASVSIVNSGREAATMVEVVFNWEPPFVNIWPARYFEKKVSADGRCSFFIQSLAPKDAIGFELLSINAEIPAIISVRSEQAVAKTIHITPQPIVPASIIWIRGWFIMAGIAMTVFIIASTIQLLAR